MSTIMMEAFVKGRQELGYARNFMAPFCCIALFYACNTCSQLQCGTVDAENTDPFVENTELKGSPLKPGAGP